VVPWHGCSSPRGRAVLSDLGIVRGPIETEADGHWRVSLTHPEWGAMTV
jgi:hypothetical protein